MRAGQAARDVLPGHPLAHHIDDFLADLANANRPRNTIRAYRGDLIGFAAHHDGDIAGLSAAPGRAFLSEIAGQAPATRKRKRAAVASFCKWAVRHELLAASPMDRIDTVEVPPDAAPTGSRRRRRAVLEATCSRRPRARRPGSQLQLPPRPAAQRLRRRVARICSSKTQVRPPSCEALPCQVNESGPMSVKRQRSWGSPSSLTSRMSPSAGRPTNRRTRQLTGSTQVERQASIEGS